MDKRRHQRDAAGSAGQHWWLTLQFVRLWPHSGSLPQTINSVSIIAFLRLFILFWPSVERPTPFCFILMQMQRHWQKLEEKQRSSRDVCRWWKLCPQLQVSLHWMGRYQMGSELAQPPALSQNVEFLRNKNKKANRFVPNPSCRSSPGLNQIPEKLKC